MNTLWLLTKKNLRLLIRAKGSALIVVFAPLLIILILGLSFNNSAKYGLNIGVYASSYSDDVNSFVSKLQEAEFKIVKYNQSSDCIEDVKLSFLHTCIFLPDSFKIEGNAQKEITFYIDPSKINLVWMIQQTLEQKMNLKSQEVSQGIAQGMIGAISDANSKVASEKEKISGVKDKSSAAFNGAESAKSSLAQIDLSTSNATYDTSILTSFKTALLGDLSNSSTSLTAAKTALNNVNMSGTDRTNLNNLLTQASTQVTSATNKLTATSGNTSLTVITTMVTEMQHDLIVAKEKVNAASAQISTSSMQLDTIKSSLGDQVKTLEGIKSTLDQINSNLNAQKVTDAKVVSSPFVTKIEKVAPENTYLNYMFPALIILVIMFSSLLLGTTLVMMERNSPAFTRNYFLPIKKITFILSTYITTLILILIQVVIILLISLVFITDIWTTLIPLTIILLLAASIFTFLGMILGYVFSSEETAILASISLGSLLLFVSGVILPLESVSPLLREVTSFNPFVLCEKLVREVVIFSSPVSTLWVDLGLIFCYALILFLIILIIESFMHQHLVNKLFHHHHKQREADKIEKKDV
jgi:ABC-2 type transport system permease protein